MTPRRLIEPARLAGAKLLRTQSDERLVDLTRDGNDRAFEAIVQRYRRSLLRYCSRMLPPARAEDAVQHAFLSAYTAICSGDAELNLKPWLYRIAHNATLNALRQNGWTHDQLDESIDGVERPDQAAERRERLGEVIAAVKALPERQRDAIVLRELEGRSYEEIASRLDVSDGAVRQLLNRARNTLRAAAAMLVPPDLAAKLAMRGEPADSIGGRIAELCSGAGGAAVAAKLGVAVVVAGAVAGGAVHAPVPGLDAGRGGTSAAAPLVAEASAATPAPLSARPAAGRGSGSLVGEDGRRQRGRGHGRGRSGAGDRPHSGGRGHRVGRDSGDRHDAQPGDDRSGDRTGEGRDDGHRSGGDSSGTGSGDSDDSLTAVSGTTTDDRLTINSGPSSSSGSGSSGSGGSTESDTSGSSGTGSDDFSSSSGTGSDDR